VARNEEIWARPPRRFGPGGCSWSNHFIRTERRGLLSVPDAVAGHPQCYQIALVCILVWPAHAKRGLPASRSSSSATTSLSSCAKCSRAAPTSGNSAARPSTVRTVNPHCELANQRTDRSSARSSARSAPWPPHALATAPEPIPPLVGQAGADRIHRGDGRAEPHAPVPLQVHPPAARRLPPPRLYRGEDPRPRPAPPRGHRCCWAVHAFPSRPPVVGPHTCRAPQASPVGSCAPRIARPDAVQHSSTALNRRRDCTSQSISQPRGGGLGEVQLDVRDRGRTCGRG
jgi:hypothetical protein